MVEERGGVGTVGESLAAQDRFSERYRKESALLQSARALVDKWKPRLGIEEWAIDLFVRDADAAGATDTTHTPYRHAYIALSQNAGESWDLETVVVHELCHVLLAPYVYAVDGLLEILEPAGPLAKHGKKGIRDASEYVTEQATKAFLRAYQEEHKH